MDVQINEWMYGCTYGWIDIWMDGWMYIWMDGWIDLLIY